MLLVHTDVFMTYTAVIIAVSSSRLSVPHFCEKIMGSVFNNL